MAQNWLTFFTVKPENNASDPVNSTWFYLLESSL